MQCRTVGTCSAVQYCRYTTMQCSTVGTCSAVLYRVVDTYSAVLCQTVSICALLDVA